MPKNYVNINFTGVLREGEAIRGGLQISLGPIGTACLDSHWTAAPKGGEQQTLAEVRGTMAKDSGVRFGTVYIRK